MKIAKKALSVFLSLLMVFTACAVGLPGLVLLADAAESKYTHEQVIGLINAATASGFTLSSAEDKWEYTADDGSAIAAAEAIFDYAVKSYRAGKAADAAGNSSEALYRLFNNEFGAEYTNATAAQRLVKNVLYPDGTTVYSYDAQATKDTTLSESQTNYGAVGTDVTGTFPLASYPSYYAAGITTAIVTKTSSVQIDLEKYLLKFESIDDIPASFISSVKYTYSHANTSNATVKENKERTETTGSGCNQKTTYYYTPTITGSYWNYMSAKPNRTVVKDKSTKKQLLNIEKFFDAERLATTFEAMLEMSNDELATYYATANSYYSLVKGFNKNIIDHFNLNYDGIVKFMEDLEFAHRIVAGKYSIDMLLTYIGSDYNEESYSEMSALHTKVSTAYNVVDTMSSKVAQYIVENGYAEQYDKVQNIKADAKAYIDTLHAVMTEQRLEELVASMVATYNEYNSKLDKENIEEPSDAEIVGLVQKVDSYNKTLAIYPGYSYYRTYYTAEIEAQWNAFCEKLDDVAEVRDIKISFNTYYDYFMPLLFTTQIVDLDDDKALDLHENFQANVDNLKAAYNECKTKWGETIANKIFTLSYDGENSLLHNLVVTLSKAELVANLVDRTEADIDAVYAKKDITVVNFDNFADIKSVLSHFNYDLYNYVTGNNLGLSADYVSKYAEVQKLLDRYHAFTTTDGKAYFNENFTFADANGIFATRYAGSQFAEVEGEDENGNSVTTTQQIGYPADIVRDGAGDNFVVTEDKLVGTVEKIDGFITSRDFGALIGFVDEDTEEATDLKTYVNQMLSTALYTDTMINTLVGAIFPMIIDLLESELVGALANIDGGGLTADGIPYIDISTAAGVSSGLLSGQLQLFLDKDRAPAHAGGEQKEFPEVFADIGLYLYPATLADSLAISNPAVYGVGSDIYNALKAAGRDWTQLVSEDDPDTLDVDETKALEFVWGVYDQDSFLDVLSCVLDAILPLLQAALSNVNFDADSSNAAVAYAPKLTAIMFLSAETWISGGLGLTIPNLNLFNTHIVPLFETLGVENIPTLSGECDSAEIVEAIFGTLLNWVDGLLDAPLSTILDVLPDLVYFLSMDSVQEIINSLVINLTLTITEVDVIDANGSISGLLSYIDQYLAGVISFDVALDLSEKIDLFDLLGFEISNFNEVITFALDALGAEISLPEINQQEIIFCSDWGTNAAGRVDLQANKADVMYWFIDYLFTALGQEGFIDGLMALINGMGGDGTATAAEGESAISGETLDKIINKVVSSVTSHPEDAVAAIVELFNPVSYDLKEMDWVDGTWNYNGIAGANNMSVVYLNYGNDWTQEDANYLVNNIDTIISTVLDMTGMEVDSLGAYLQDKINGFFTNENITALVEMLGGFGDSASGVIEDIVKNQIGIDLNSWFVAFGYLFPEGTWADDAEIVKVTDRHYVNNFGVEGVANEDGTISWFFNKMPLVDGDGYTFINILTRLLGEASLVIEFLFAGENIAAFEDLLTIKGYESYNTTFGLLLEVLGVDNIPTQADFNADAMGSFTNMLMAMLDWFYALTESDNMIAQLLELIPDLFYYIESNGLSVLLHNLLMPVLVLVDTVRPLIDVDLNGIVSLLVSDLLNYRTVNLGVILDYVMNGTYTNDDPEYTYYSVDIKNLTLSDIIKIADQYLGTNLYESGLVQIGIKGLCSGVETVENTAVGTIKRTTVTAADAITIIVTALLDSLSYPAKDAQYTNGDVLFSKLAELTGNDFIADIYSMLVEIIAGIDVEYGTPNWGYMFESNDLFDLTLPEQSIVYLEYTTDWTPEAAQSVYGVLDEILDMVFPALLGEENADLADLINGILEDNVYTDANLNTVVELIVNAISALDATLRDTIDVVVDTDIASWFTMCKYNEETEEYECTKAWGVDNASDKKAAFIAGIKEVLAPANELLAWLFFGADYAFFTGSEKDDEGNYIYNDLITLAGGEAYAYGLAPILEALGCTLAAPETFYDAQTETYNVGAAVESILNSVLALVDEISANPVEEVFNLLPNLIYFINADGLKVSVSNLLAPVNAILEAVSELTGGVLVNTLLKDLVGFDITELSMDTLLGIAADAGLKLNQDMVDILCNLYVGKLAEFTSVNGNKAYRLDVTGYEGDVLTIILSIALDAFNLNAEIFSDLLGEETYYAVYNLIKGATEAFVYRDMNWSYMYNGEDAASQLYENNLPEREGDAYQIYTQYQNNWNEATADYLVEVLDKLVKAVTSAISGSDSSIGKILDDAISNGLYQDSILNSLIEMVVGLLVDYEEIVKGAGALLGAESISEWFDYCEITEENGETVVTCTKDWGIDSAVTNDEKRTAFVEGFVTALKPAYRLLAWLLFAEDYTFFNGTTGEPLITITGGAGYDNAIVLLLEGLSASMTGADGTYLNGTSAIKSAEEFYVDGKLDMEQAVRDVFGAVTGFLYEICGDLANQDEDGALASILEKLPNLLYFINADGLKVVVNNLLVPVNALLEALAPLGVELDLNELIGMDITNFDFYAIFDLVEDLLGFAIPDYAQDFFATFYIGQVVNYESANGELAYYMTYSEAEPERDLITCLISLVVDVFEDPENDDVFIDLLGADAYNAIISLLNISEAKAMQEFSWLYTEYADTDEEFSAIESSLKYEYAYDAIWTEEMAEYISDNLVDFTTKIIALLGLEINGYQIKSIDDLINAYLNGDLYTQSTADSILDFFKNLTDLFGDYAELGNMAIGILDKAIGTSMGSWAEMEVTVEDGNRESFVAALKEILAPIVPLLDVLLCGEDLSFFYSYADGSEQITIPGSEGYAYGIIPLFEALGCTMRTPAEFYALADDAKIGAILDSLLDRVDEIMLDPVNEIFAMLPAIIYFINSNGLDTSVNNIVNTVDTVLAALEPLLGAPDLMSLLGIDLAEYDFAYIAQVLADAITGSTGMEAEALIVDAVAELTMGKVLSYQSANGETYYTMVYANDEQLKDMVTVLLRLAVDFISTAENADAIAALIIGNTENEEAAKSARTFISLVLQGLGVKPATSGSMATIYYIFYGLKQGVDVIYDNYYDSWIALLDLFKEDERPIIDKLASLIGGILGDFAGFENGSEVDNCKCSCHSKNAVVSLIHTILNIIRRIFKQTEYRYCACGVDHWDFASKSKY